jgi:hypothetical protein
VKLLTCSSAIALDCSIPVWWNFSGNLLIVKLVGPYINDQLYQAFAEALASSEWPADAAVLCDVRYAQDAISPAVIPERVQFVFDAIRGKVARYVILTEPGCMLLTAESVVRQLTALGMETRHFTNLEQAVAWLRSTKSGLKTGGLAAA